MTTTIVGAVKIKDFPEEGCIRTVEDLLQQLQKYLAVELPVSQITNVVVGASEPDSGERDVVWFRLNNAGSFVGIFIFVQGEWLQMFPAPSAVFRMVGDSRDVPLGYALVTDDLPGYTSAMVNHLMSRWLLDPTGTYYRIFDVVYVGL